MRDGFILDGTGCEGFVGDVLVQGQAIEDVSPGRLEADCPVVDCTGKAIAPGFIDAHSHMDWVLPLPDHALRLAPYHAQGCTTFVAGNCGYGVAGFRKDTRFRELLNADLAPETDLSWDTLEEYHEHLRSAGMSHNLAAMVGHGTTRASMRGLDPAPLGSDEMKELLRLLEEAMDQGAAGASLGLQYAPGLFAPMEELEAVARLVKKKDKVLAVHGRAYSSLSAEYPPKLFGIPHNLLAFQEMLGLARKTSVRLQYSHLIFAGRKTHRTCTGCIEALDAAIADGVDVQIDTYPYHCGNSVLEVVIPRWFRERLPGNYDNRAALLRLRAEFTALTMFVGLGYEDIQIAHAGHPDFNRFNGMFVSEIAREWGIHPFKAFIRLAKGCHGCRTTVLIHQYGNQATTDALIAHPACLFMTDAVPGEHTRNPANIGSFPRFLQHVREGKQINLHDAVRKMTGATADRFQLKDRGYLKPGMAADITVFDPDEVRDNTTREDPYAAPSGIEAVFVNGQLVCRDGRVATETLAGVPLSC